MAKHVFAVVDPDGVVVRSGFRGLAVFRRYWLPVIALAGLGVVLFTAYLHQAQTFAARSSSAGQALQGWEMLHGNLLLHGWTLSDVSFYTTEIPEYALVEAARGLNGDTVHIAAALSYTLVVLLGGLLARGRARGTEGVVRLLIAAGIMLAPSLRFGTQWLLAGPDHLGTHVALLAIWLVLDRKRPRWWVPAAVAVLLTWAMVADMLVLYEGVLPLLVVCALRMIRRRGPLAGHWYELSLAAAGVGSVLAARLILAAIHQAGGFLVGTPVTRIASLPVMRAELWPKIHNVLAVFGVSFSGPSPGRAALFAVIHLAGVALVVWAVLSGLRRLFSETDLIAQLLTVAFVLLLGAYLIATKGDANEVVGLLPIGAVLAGRRLAGPLTRGRVRPALAALALAAAVLMLADNAVQPVARPSGNQLAARWLAAHHLVYGLAGYWNASSITVDAGGRVKVRPARMYQNRIVTTPSESDVRWYQPGQHVADFVVLAPRESCLNVCLSGPDLRAEFGPPAKGYRIGHFQVLVWRKNLLSNLPVLSWCGGAWSWISAARPAPAACPGRPF